MKTTQDKVRTSESRREFLKIAGLSTAALITPRFLFASPVQSSRRVRIGIIGGRFGLGFFFHEHPNCTVEAVSDLREDRRKALMKTYGCQKSYTSLTALLKDKNVEAVFIATPAPDHAQHVIESLRAGNRVLCAVSAAMTLEECAQIREMVQQTGLTYMMAQPSTYRQGAISAKKFFQEGKFSSIFSAAA